MKLTEFGKKIAACAIIIILAIAGVPMLCRHDYCYNIIYMTTILPLGCAGLTYTVDFDSLFKKLR